MALLEIKDIHVYYGVIQALKGISFEVNQGEVVALIGANGAGKTTTLHTITGLLKAKSGHVLFNGKEISKIPAHKICKHGNGSRSGRKTCVCYMTVLQNLKMGAFTRKDKGRVSKRRSRRYTIISRDGRA